MKDFINKLFSTAIFLFVMMTFCCAQNTITGNIVDEYTGDPLIGASVVVKGTSEGNVTDWEGNFALQTESAIPLTIVISYLGYVEMEVDVPDLESLKLKMQESSITIDVVEVKGQRISDRQKSSPLTIESLDLIAIKETPSSNFYDGLGSLKDVDLTTASLGFTIINTRGFNSTSPVRSLQIIDGIDNQSPGLNFSLGNFLGASELDVNSVELIVGASSAFYGPNAFNGVISMKTKDPFFHKGLGASLKFGERSLFEAGIRWADAFTNDKGHDWFAYKINMSYMKAYDWEADNYDAVYNSRSEESNPGGFDAVNIYGDEFTRWLDFTNSDNPGLGIVHRTGYLESDLVDYDSENMKASGSLHFRLNPEEGYNAHEIVLGSNFGGGTTVYQGDNRYSLKNIKFFQHKAEIRQKDNYFLRAYLTHEDAGDTYDPYFTALQIQSANKEIFDWQQDYSNYWGFNVNPFLKSRPDFPRKSDFPGDRPGYDIAIKNFLGQYTDSLIIWHQQAEDFANSETMLGGAHITPGSTLFDSLFRDITSRNAFSEGGTRFFDKSALIHINGQKDFNNVYQGSVVNNLNFKAGANYRKYMPNSQGSILLDTFGRNIDTYEYGFYGGADVSFINNTLKLSATARLDKHQNFDYLVSPAFSAVYNPSPDNYLRVSFSSAIRNPTLSDQYLRYNVGPAVLLGNITGFDSLITIPSLIDYLSTFIADPTNLEYFNIDPIRPEKVKTIEVGYRTTLFESLFADLGYYFSQYDDFIGYQLGSVIQLNPFTGGVSDLTVYRVASNAQDKVTTQGFSIGLNYYFGKYYMFKGNYSWNVLNTQTDDPIIPAFNTPEHKFNLSISAREMQIGRVENIGFNVNYKWIDGFLFEGSPQFTGFIPTYALLDAQVNWRWVERSITFKLGASNLLNTMNFQTYGGPRIGRLAYFSVLYDWKKN